MLQKKARLLSFRRRQSLLNGSEKGRTESILIPVLLFYSFSSWATFPIQLLGAYSTVAFSDISFIAKAHFKEKTVVLLPFTTVDRSCAEIAHDSLASLHAHVENVYSSPQLIPNSSIADSFDGLNC